MRISPRSILLLTSVVAILLAIGLGLLHLKEHLENSISNSYRLVSAGELFLDYKEETGSWPNDWESLQEYAESHGSQLYACETFDDLRNNIEIDFSIDLTSVDTASSWSEKNPQMRIIASTTGQTQGAVFNPNELIYLQLQRESETMRTKE